MTCGSYGYVGGPDACFMTTLREPVPPPAAACNVLATAPDESGLETNEPGGDPIAGPPSIPSGHDRCACSPAIDDTLAERMLMWCAVGIIMLEERCSAESAALVIEGRAERTRTDLLVVALEMVRHHQRKLQRNSGFIEAPAL